MRRFNYRLQPLLEIKKKNEEEIKLRLAAKNRELLFKKQNLAQLYKELDSLQNSEKKTRANQSNVLLLRASVAYRHKLRGDILKTSKELEKIIEEAEQIRRELVKAKRELRAIEILRERRYAEWKKNYKREEQDVIDDVSQKEYIRIKQASNIKRNTA